MYDYSNYTLPTVSVGGVLGATPTFTYDSSFTPTQTFGFTAPANVGNVKSYLDGLYTVEPATVNVGSIMPTSTVGDVVYGTNTLGDKLVNGLTNINPKLGALGGSFVNGMRNKGNQLYDGAKQTAGQYGNAFGAMTTGQKAGMFLEGVGSVMNALNARKQVKLAKQQLNHVINNDNRNYEMARRSYNSNLEERQRYREAYWRANNGGDTASKPLSVNDYMNKYGA